MKFSIRQLLVLTAVIALVLQTGKTGRRVTALRQWAAVSAAERRDLEIRLAPERLTDSICEALLEDREYFSTIEYPSNVKIVYPSKAYLSVEAVFQKSQLDESDE